MRKRLKRVCVVGTAERPRLSVFRSPKHIHAQLIDDGAGKTLFSSSSLEFRKAKQEEKGKIEIAKQVGKNLAERASAKGVKKVVFDRGLARYHGRVKALADAAREGGLLF